MAEKSNGVAIVIPARMDSGRLPGKPLREARGKPLLQWAVEASKASKLAGYVAVATDSVEIERWCINGSIPCCCTPDRPYRTGSDRVYGAIEAFQTEGHNWGPFKIVVNLQCDEPEITGDHLDRLISEMQVHRRPVSTYAYAIPAGMDICNRNVVKVLVDCNHDAIYFSRLALPGAGLIHAGVYAYRLNELRSFTHQGWRRLEKAEDLEQLRLIEAGVPIRVLDIGAPVVSINTEDDLRGWNEG